MKIKISADSTCDLSKELVEKNDISIVPLFVSLGSEKISTITTLQQKSCPKQAHAALKSTAISSAIS